ncbi:MAG: hypothetical protein WB341_13955 [Terracidiphilus sp.]
MTELGAFNAAMDTILRADPAKVKAEVDAEIEANRAERKAKGEHKRGRKPQSSTSSGAARVSGERD